MKDGGFVSDQNLKWKSDKYFALLKKQLDVE
jgi:hypothetical protein